MTVNLSLKETNKPRETMNGEWFYNPDVLLIIRT